MALGENLPVDNFGGPSRENSQMSCPLWRVNRPYLAHQRDQTRRRRYILLGDITVLLQRESPEYAEIAVRFADLPAAALSTPLDERVTAFILGDPEP